jgi:hypothetical protein
VPGLSQNACTDRIFGRASPTASAKEAGAVFVFDQQAAGEWKMTAVLTAPNPTTNDFFGSVVAMRDDLLFVSATGDDGAPTDRSSASELMDSGVVFVFKRDGESWRQQQRLTPNNAMPGAGFGSALAVDGDTLAVGAWFDSHGERGINSPPTHEESMISGAAYVFREHDGRWEQEAYIKAFNRDAGDVFGTNVALDKDMLIVTALFEAGSRPSAQAHELATNTSDDNAATNAGAVYVFRRQDEAWAFETYLKAPQPAPQSYFGVAVSIHSGRILIGALGEHENAGAAYLYERQAGVFVPRATFRPRIARPESFYGNGVALSERWIVISSTGNQERAGWISVFDLEQVLAAE